MEGGVITEGQGTNEVTVVWYEDGMESLSVVETTEEGCVGEVVELEIDVVTEVGDRSNGRSSDLTSLWARAPW